MSNFQDIILYSSLSEAGRQNNLTSSSIAHCCKREQVSVGGYYWAYEKDYNSNWKPLENKNIVKVICVETQKIYNSIVEASKDTGCSQGNIGQCCRGERLSTHNLHWAYLKDYTKNYKIRKKKTTGKPVLCLETSQIYESVVEAARQLKTDNSTICKACKNPNKRVSGYHWRYVED